MTTPSPPPPSPQTVVVTIPPETTTVTISPGTSTVTLPPEVIDRLAPPEHSWIYDNIATLSGAVLTLVAAVIAYFTIRHQVEREEKRHRRGERLAVVTEAYDLVEVINTKRSKPREQDIGEFWAQERQAIEERNVKVTSLTTRLRLLGMGSEANAIIEFRDAVDMYRQPGYRGGGTVDGGIHLSRLYDHTRRLLASTIEDQAIGPAPPRGAILGPGDGSSGDPT